MLPEEEDVVEASPSDRRSVESVPAGGAGADSGATDAVKIDPEDEAAVENVSTHNREPGVGTRPARR